MQVGILELLPSSQHVVFAGMSKTKQGGWDMMRAKCHQLEAKCHQCNLIPFSFIEIHFFPEPRAMGSHVVEAHDINIRVSIRVGGLSGPHLVFFAFGYVLSLKFEVPWAIAAYLWSAAPARALA